MSKLRWFQKQMQIKDQNFNIVNVLKSKGDKNIPMDKGDLKTILDTLKKKKKNPDSTYMVRALTPVGWRTIKGYLQDYSEETVSSYWTETNRISDKSTVTKEFYQIQVSIKY